MRARFCISAVVIAANLACSGIDFEELKVAVVGGEPEEQFDAFTSCEAYVEAFNALQCSPVSFTVESLCAPELKESSCDLNLMFECMTNNLSCVDGRLEHEAVVACQTTHACL